MDKMNEKSNSYDVPTGQNNNVKVSVYHSDIETMLGFINLGEIDRVVRMLERYKNESKNN